MTQRRMFTSLMALIAVAVTGSQAHAALEAVMAISGNPLDVNGVTAPRTNYYIHDGQVCLDAGQYWAVPLPVGVYTGTSAPTVNHTVYGYSTGLGFGEVWVCSFYPNNAYYDCKSLGFPTAPNYELTSVTIAVPKNGTLFVKGWATRGTDSVCMDSYWVI